jgi:hypothetical protein
LFLNNSVGSAEQENMVGFYKHGNETSASLHVMFRGIISPLHVLHHINVIHLFVKNNTTGKVLLPKLQWSVLHGF